MMFTQVIMSLLMLSCMANAENDNPYCAISVNHTLCKYQPKGCKVPLIVDVVSLADQEAILKAHNNLRSTVANGQQSGQPSASNMRELKWEPELAKIAQRWADQCTFAHDQNRNTAKYWWVGQNIAGTGSGSDDPAANFTRATYMWYNEVVNNGFDPNNIDPFVFSSSTGHYTQVVWAKTDRIGCGYAFYQESPWYNKYYVCNYGIGGNVKGSSMYKKGAAASACDGAKSTAYQGLCAS